MTEPKRRGRPPLARAEGSDLPRPAARHEKPATVFAAYVVRFQAEHSDEWESLRLCPLQHGLDVMAERLKD